MSDEPMTTATERNAGTVDSFLAAILSGTGIPADLYAPDAELDVTVPNWRFTVRGPEAIVAEYATWFADPGQFEEMKRIAVPDGEIVFYLLTWTENGVPHAAHHCHILTLGDDGRIASEVVFCGGRWPAPLLAEMAAAQ